MLLASTVTHVPNYSVIPHMTAVLIVTTVRISNFTIASDRDEVYTYKNHATAFKHCQIFLLVMSWI